MSQHSNTPPISWVDVARVIASVESGSCLPPRSVCRIRTNWDQLSILMQRGTADIDQRGEIASWLNEIFPGRIIREPFGLQLEGPAHASILPIDIEEQELPYKYRPSFGIIDGTVEFGNSTVDNAPVRPVPIVAVQSVKGGTGRTTTAVALALRWNKISGRAVLLVDADLEAPGISYLFRDIAGNLKISLEDVIALAHADPDENSTNTVSFVSQKLQDHSLSKGIFILPLRRDLEELAVSGVRPEHLSTPERPFALADIISAIAARIGCCGVVIDVRAGLVPLGVNLALDPEVAPVIVTSLADQSIKATRALVHFLAREIRRAGGQPREPLLIVNRVPSIFQQTGMDEKITEPLISGIVSDIFGESSRLVDVNESVLQDALDVDPITVIRVTELPDLQVSSGNWDAFVNQIESSGFSRALQTGLDKWLDSAVGARSTNLVDIENVATSTFPSLEDRRARLRDFATEHIAAEQPGADVSKPLVTKPLSALSERFKGEVPIAVSEGAKGTGKTLNARYLVAQKLWSKAVQELGGGNNALPAFMLPVCGSIQSSSSVLTQFDSARREIAAKLGNDDPMPIYETTSWLREQRRQIHGEQGWVDAWLDVTAWSAGFMVKQPGAGTKFLEMLRQKQLNAVVLVEGLEELYSTVSDQGVPEMMRAMLVDLPQRLRSEVRRPLGLIAFARRDTVEKAIPQNIDQYRREYASYALSWDEDDILELAAWFATKSGALPNLWSESFSQKALNDKKIELEALWGKKLGKDDVPTRRVKEAYTATWIIAVLSDLQGRLVPRDLVRFLAHAARMSPNNDEEAEYPTRLLVPRALRSAVEPTSTAKIEETEEEIAELQPIFAKFRQTPDANVAPLEKAALDALNLSDADVETLRRHGIILGDAPPYEIPELFRRGLGLRHAGARRSVVNLYRRARQRLGAP